MRTGLAALALSICCLAPAAGAQSLTNEEAKQLLAAQQIAAHPAECARLRRQIDHFTVMASRADALENEMWEQRMAQQLGMLRGMQAARCPNDVPVDTTAEALKQLMMLAAKGAIAYFTFGAAGF